VWPATNFIKSLLKVFSIFSEIILIKFKEHRCYLLVLRHGVDAFQSRVCLLVYVITLCVVLAVFYRDMHRLAVYNKGT
jgi:hypothetical protein